MDNSAILSKDQKIFSMQELMEKGFSQYKIRKLVSEGKLIKLNKGYYENAEYSGEESDFYLAVVYAPQGVICLLSAAVYYNLTTYIPDSVDVAIPRKSKISSNPEWPRLICSLFRMAGNWMMRNKKFFMKSIQKHSNT